jgi:hypothetical protein
VKDLKRREGKREKGKKKERKERKETTGNRPATNQPS